MSHDFRRALFLSSEHPFETFGGKSARDSHLLRLLLEQMDVELVCLQQNASKRAATRERNSTAKSELAREMDCSRIDVDHLATLGLPSRMFHPLHPRAVHPPLPALKQLLRDRIEKFPPATSGRTLLWISRLSMAPYIPLAKKLGYTVVLDEQIIESYRRIDRILGSARTWYQLPGVLQLKLFETKWCRTADALVTTSEIDAARIQKVAGDLNVHVIPKSVDAEKFASLRGTRGEGLLFAGRLDLPGVAEGIHWFADEILPRLRAYARGAGISAPKVMIAGTGASAELTRRMVAAGIELHLDPPSILPLLEKAAVVFVPLKIGAGSRLLILEAMAAGRPVVSTGAGAEGLTLAPSYDIAIQEDEDSFATSLIQLIKESPERTQMVERARLTVDTLYDWRAARPALERILDELARRPA